MVAEKQKQLGNTWQGSGVVHLNSIHIKKAFILCVPQASYSWLPVAPEDKKNIFRSRIHKHMIELYKVLTF